MNKVLVVADVDWWAFERIVQGLKKYCTRWQVDSCYIRLDTAIRHQNYDVVFYLCDWIPEPIFQNRIPKSKLVLAIRQSGQINNRLYTVPGLLSETVNMVAVSNKGIYDRYSKIHPCVKVAPGGVDTDFFSFVKKDKFHWPIRIGWAGSSRFCPDGWSFRGLDIIEDTSKKLCINFYPALREEKLRTAKEMVDYYHKEIDFYVDLSETAGRQNGLIEAGSCGVPVISCRAGIAEELIVSGENGYLVERNIESLSDALLKVMHNKTKDFGLEIRKTIEEKWSWKVQAPIFENIFDECKGTQNG